MTKQEKIRKMTKNYLVGCIHGARVSYEDLSGYDKSTVDFETDELLEEQSKLGVVIKVDRELPRPAHVTDEAWEWVNPFLKRVREEYEKAGYGAFEPLIET